MACSSLAELIADLKALQLDMSEPSPDFLVSRKPPFVSEKVGVALCEVIVAAAKTKH